MTGWTGPCAGPCAMSSGREEKHLNNCKEQDHDRDQRVKDEAETEFPTILDLSQDLALTTYPVLLNGDSARHHQLVSLLASGLDDVREPQ